LHGSLKVNGVNRKEKGELAGQNSRSRSGPSGRGKRFCGAAVTNASER
jgi:hypothetical protein